MLQHDAGWIAVVDGDRFAGVLTPATLHTALRRSVNEDGDDGDVEDENDDAGRSVAAGTGPGDNRRAEPDAEAS